MHKLTIFQYLLYLVAIVGMGFTYVIYARHYSAVKITVLLTASIFLLILSNGIPYIWLFFSGVAGKGSVVAIDCERGEKHHVHYSFSDGSVVINDTSLDGYGNLTCDKLKIGDSGVVTYIESEPTIHVWGKAYIHLGEHLILLLFVMLGVPVISYSSIKQYAS